MLWESEDVEKAFHLYLQLSKKGYVLETEGDYLLWYEEREVQEVIRQMVEPVAKVTIFKDDETDTLQLVPNVDNDYMSYKNEDLKKELNFKDNNEVHLFYFILYHLVSEFTQSSDSDLSKRLYLPMEELLEKVNLYIERFEELGDEMLGTMTERYKVDILGVVEAWGRMAEFKEGAKNHKRTKENHRMYIEKTVSFLEKHKLVRVRSLNEIQISNKMENIIQHYYNDVQNKHAIAELLRGDHSEDEED